MGVGEGTQKLSPTPVLSAQTRHDAETCYFFCSSGEEPCGVCLTVLIWEREYARLH